MKQKLRESLPVKITALGFITLIIAGNFWLINHFTGTPPALALKVAGVTGFLAVLLGGVCILGMQIWEHFRD